MYRLSDKSETRFVRSAARYSIFHGRSNSPVGRNVLFCFRRYGWAVKDIFHSRSVDGVIWNYVDNSVSVSQRNIASLVSEMLGTRYGFLTLDFLCTTSDFNYSIICDI